MTEDERSILAACTAFGNAMRHLDFQSMQRMWDQDYEHLVYQPEEYERACRSWNDIVSYWNYIPGVVESVSEWREIEIDVAVLGDAAIVYCLIATGFRLKDVEQSLEGVQRFSFGLRRSPGGWRFIHCHESRRLAVDDPAPAEGREGIEG